MALAADGPLVAAAAGARARSVPFGAGPGASGLATAPQTGGGSDGGGSGGGAAGADDAASVRVREPSVTFQAEGALQAMLPSAMAIRRVDDEATPAKATPTKQAAGRPGERVSAPPFGASAPSALAVLEQPAAEPTDDPSLPRSSPAGLHRSRSNRSAMTASQLNVPDGY